MSLITRTAMLQARVRPEIKFASEDLLRRIGLNLTEAMELFLCRMIIDQRLPFEVVAFDPDMLAAVNAAWQAEQRHVKKVVKADDTAVRRSSRRRSRLRRQ
jgi:addiction module RelB/DinJ family antitoxin